MCTLTLNVCALHSLYTLITLASLCGVYKAHLEWLGIRPHYPCILDVVTRVPNVPITCWRYPCILDVATRACWVQECPTCSSVLAHLSTRCGVHSDTLHNYVQLCMCIRGTVINCYGTLPYILWTQSSMCN